jgi:hypothetical protein
MEYMKIQFLPQRKHKASPLKTIERGGRVISNRVSFSTDP